MRWFRPRPDDDAIGPAGWCGIAVLFGLLGWALWYGIRAWLALPGVALSPLGWLFLILGIVFSALVGGGLMALVFYSSRHGFDE